MIKKNSNYKSRHEVGDSFRFAARAFALKIHSYTGTSTIFQITNTNLAFARWERERV